MFCLECGHRNVDAAQFCSNCGLALTRPPGGARRWTLGLAAGLVLLAFLAVTAVVLNLVFDSLGRPASTRPERVVVGAQEAGSATAPVSAPTTSPMPAATEAFPTEPPAAPSKTPAPSLPPVPTKTLTPSATPSPLPSATPTPAPPTGYIIFTCFINGFDQICRMKADGSDQQRLTNGSVTDFYASPSADGQQIAFSSRRSGSFLLYLMNADGSGQRQIGPTHIGGLYAPDISLDGRQVLFAAVLNDAADIWVMNIDGTGLTQLTFTGDNLDPTWSPDGQQIAFASSRGGSLDYYVMNGDGSNARALITGVADIGGRSDWSPNSQWLGFYAGPRDGRNLYLAAIDGSTTRRLTDGGGNLAPAFSPDGHWLAFTSYRDADGDAEIFIMRVGGSGIQQLTFNDRPDWQPRWGP